jgi:hypothetical protein
MEFKISNIDLLAMPGTSTSPNSILKLDAERLTRNLARELGA